ncbi:fibronectin type III domain-containing protein [Paenibacillus oenotherae]|uniref:Fibronectin type III domain-containing protein n=1 Tax=Paenibacillus oenotherae TaxID=1435645 RepID=A0ABS7D252_9BACL|nr:fibronectin type III domain-containing protein [Paenibacillus oenotherae]MBW7473876.1 fibronectin type III domain-containing protein [Paenibacillus oenotherae]
MNFKKVILLVFVVIMLVQTTAYAGPMIYIYDDNNRLSQIEFEKDGKQYRTSYTYDHNGNMINQITAEIEGGAEPPVSNGFVKVSAGYDFSFAIKADGSLWAWGNNSYGQLGTGAEKVSSIGNTPVLVEGIADVETLSGGTDHTLALKKDGTVWSWGRNYKGQLGQGVVVLKPVPEQVVGLSEIEAVAAGSEYNLVLKNDGTVWSWGDNTYGQLGDGTTTNRSSPVQVTGLSDVVAVAAGNNHSMAVKSDGTVWTWGENSYQKLGDWTYANKSVPVQVTNLSGVVAVAAGYYHSVALKTDGTVWTWGNNGSGQLGNGTLNYFYPVKVSGLDGIVEIKSGSNHNIAVSGDGSVWRWGNNNYGQLGDGTFVNRSSPVHLSELSITEIAIGANHSIALQTDGTVMTWGSNNFWQLGNGSFNNRNTPAPTKNINSIIATASGYGHHLVVQYDGSLWAWGQNSYGQLGDGLSGLPRYSPILVPSLTSVVSIAAGNQHSIAVISDGTVWTWGRNNYGQLGDGTEVNRYEPVQLSGLSSVISVVAGGNYSLAIKRDGTVWAWGDNSYGQLGDGSNTNRLSPVQVIGLDSVVAVAVGSNHSLAVKSDGTVWGWGLTNGSGASNNTPVQLSGLNSVVAVSAGDFHSTALKSDGSVWMWGVTKQEGNTTYSTVSPVQVPGLTDVVAIEDGRFHRTAVRSDGTVWVWGRNQEGQLGGAANKNYENTPTQMPELEGIVNVSVGEYHSVGVKSDGSLVMWGSIGIDGWGDGTLLTVHSPVESQSLSSIVEIDTDRLHTLALKSDGTVLAYGYNLDGQVGDTIGGSNPILVPGIDSIVSISAGYSHNLAVKSDGSVWAWGTNAYQELGDGTNITRSAPVRVLNLNDVKFAEAGWNHSFAVKNDGSVWRWGLHTASPVQVPGLSSIIALATGSFHCIALKSDGTVWTWGSNQFGQLGDGTTTSQAFPIQVPELDSIVAIAAGQAHNLAVKSDGSVWAWGNNGWGQLGDGTTTTNRLSPVRVSGLGSVKAVAAGAVFSLAVQNDGSMWGWGDNQYSQLSGGIGTNNRTLPVLIKNNSSVIAVSAGERHSVAVQSDGKALGWGYNYYRQLGIEAPVREVWGSYPTEQNIPVSHTKTDTSIALKWLVNDAEEAGIANYEIYQGVERVGETTTRQFEVTNLRPSTRYLFQIKGINAAGQVVAESGLVAISTMADTTAPTAPSGLQLLNTMGTYADLAWNASTDNVGVTGYEVLVDGVVKGTFTDTSGIITGLEAGHAYAITVRAYDAAGNRSAASAALTATLLPDTAAPTTPVVQAEAVTESGVTLTWQPATDNVAVVSYEIQQNQAVIRIEPGSATTYLVTGLKPNTAHTFAVTALDGSGNRSAEGTVNVTTLADQTAPSVPVGVQMNSYTSDSISLTWEASTDNAAVTGYDIYRDGVLAGSSLLPTYVVVGLQPNVPYTFTVKAKDGSGNVSGFSQPLAATIIPDDEAPAAPLGLEAEAWSEREATLRWQPATDNVGVVSYAIFRDNTVIGHSSTPTFTDTGLQPGTTYMYTVKARDGAGNLSPASPAITIVTRGDALADGEAPSTPQSLAVDNRTGTSLDLVWLPSTDNVGVSGYEIYAGETLLGTSVTNRFTVDPVDTATSYAFTVRALDAAGNRSERSAALHLAGDGADTEAPSAPTNLSADATTDTTVQLSWTASTDNIGVSGYDIYNGSTLIGSVNGTTTAFTAAGLTANTTYLFTVHAKDAAANVSAASQVFSVTTTGANLLLNGGFETYTGSSGVADNWIKSSSAGASAVFQTVSNPVAEGIQAQQMTASGMANGDSAKIQQLVTMTPSTAYTVSGQFNVASLTGAKVQLYVDFLDASNAIVGTAKVEQLDATSGYITLTKSGVTPATAAKAKVYAILRGTAAGGAGNFTVDDLRVTQAPPPGDTEAPSAPGSLLQTGTTETTVALSWTASTDNVGVSGYDLYNGSSLIGSVSGTTTAFTATGLTAGTAYTFTAKAKDAAGNVSAASNALNVTTVSSPLNLLLNGGFETYTGSSGVADNWIKSSSAGITVSFQTVNTPVAEGAQAQQITGSGLANGDTAKIQQLVNVAPNTAYTVSGQVHAASLTGARIQLYVDFLDASNVIVGTAKVEQLDATSGYITLSKSGVTPTTAAKAKVYAILRGTAAGGAGSFIVDDMRLISLRTGKPLHDIS